MKRRQNRSTIPRWSQWVLGSVMLLSAIAAGTLGLTLNVTYGLQTGVATAVAFGLADISKISIPIIAGIIGWSRQLRLTAALCVATSLWAATNYYIDAHTNNVATKQHGEAIYTDKRASVSSLEANVASLDAMVVQEAQNGGCKSRCKALMEQASQARTRLQEARSSWSAAKPVKMSSLSASSASGFIQAALFLALIEGLVWLSVPAMSALVQAATIKAKTKKRRKAARKSRWTSKQSQQMLQTALTKPDRRKRAKNDNVPPVPAN